MTIAIGAVERSATAERNADSLQRTQDLLQYAAHRLTGTGATVHDTVSISDTAIALVEGKIPAVTLKRPAARFETAPTSGWGYSVAVVQLIEVTPDKKVVWALRDWNTSGQPLPLNFLTNPGIAENGDLQR